MPLMNYSTCGINDHSSGSNGITFDVRKGFEILSRGYTNGSTEQVFSQLRAEAESQSTFNIAFYLHFAGPKNLNILLKFLCGMMDGQAGTTLRTAQIPHRMTHSLHVIMFHSTVINDLDLKID